jgi:uncharacterized protein (TIGR03084 family)
VEEIVAALGEQHAELAGLLEGLAEEDWRRPTPSCPGWTVLDVVLHLAQTDEVAIESARGSFGSELAGMFADGRSAGTVDEAAEAMVVAERDTTGAELFVRWKSGADTLREVLAITDPSSRKQWVVGDLSARTLATTRLSECWIHTRDIAEALGIELDPPDRLWHIARLAWRTIPYAFANAGCSAPGPVALELSAPNDAVWEFTPDVAPTTVIRGDAIDWCLVAGQRLKPQRTSLIADGPDGAAVLELVRTYAQ